MRHSEFPLQICSVARSLEVVGEWWTLLIVREAFFGTRRFTDFEGNLGIPRMC
jgi:DNA-binding HxlR family transcriptional regulator